ncbi:MAG: signal peptidase I [Notoacmeibacter sp.]|nr:signal peptidase I [Notoacmeibacter sp.]
MSVNKSQVRDIAGTVAITALVVFVMKSFAFASNYIPSESMVPTLEVGDRLFVARWPYGVSRYSLAVNPGFSLGGGDGRLLSHVPARGDIVTFAHPANGETYVKRVIGLPGDRVALSHGRLFINGEIAARRMISTYDYRTPAGNVARVTRYAETLPGGAEHAIIERGDDYLADNMNEITVPQGKLFLMGDNRDNSADSRFAEMGFVPLENLEGRVDAVLWSLHSCDEEPDLACARKRFLAKVE